MSQKISDKCRDASRRGYVFAAMVVSVLLRAAARHGYVFAAVMVSVLLHAAAIEWWRHRPTQVLEMSGVQEVTMSLIALQPELEPVIQPPPPVPVPPEPELLREDEMAVKHKVVKKKPPEKKPQPVQQPVQEQPVTTASEQKPAAAPITAARYDADYLNNPAPPYPALSRRLEEEGRVLLRVQVSAEGNVLAVELKKSSGFERLDEAASKAAAKWRFAPARQGDKALTSWVEIPIQFSLNNKRGFR